MTRMESEEGVMLRQRFIMKPGLASPDYTSLPPVQQNNQDSQDFISLQGQEVEGVRGKIRILTKDLVTISARDSNNNGGGHNKW